MSIRVAIADDHPALLAGAEQVLAKVPDVTIMGLASDSTQLVELLGHQVVDVVVADFSMPQGRYGDGITLLRFLRRRFPQVRLALLTSAENPQLLRGAMDVGVSAIVSKADHYDCLEEAIRAAYANRTYLSPHARQLVDQAEVEDAKSGAAHLSKREAEVLRMFAEGLSLTEIGERVGRSPKTISTQKLSAMKKLGLRGDRDIFQYAITNGLIQASQASRKDATSADEDE